MFCNECGCQNIYLCPMLSQAPKLRNIPRQLPAGPLLQFLPELLLASRAVTQEVIVHLRTQRWHHDERHGFNDSQEHLPFEAALKATAIAQSNLQEGSSVGTVARTVGQGHTGRRGGAGEREEERSRGRRRAGRAEIGEELQRSSEEAAGAGASPATSPSARPAAAVSPRTR